jgi:hypothetical protein
VLHAAGDDKELAFLQLDVAVAQLDRQVSLKDEEKVIRVIVLVPDELALDLHDADVVVVESSRRSSDAGAPGGAGVCRTG